MEGDDKNIDESGQKALATLRLPLPMRLTSGHNLGQQALWQNHRHSKHIQ